MNIETIGIVISVLVAVIAAFRKSPFLMIVSRSLGLDLFLHVISLEFKDKSSGYHYRNCEGLENKTKLYSIILIENSPKGDFLSKTGNSLFKDFLNIPKKGGNEEIGFNSLYGGISFTWSLKEPVSNENFKLYFVNMNNGKKYLIDELQLKSLLCLVRFGVFKYKGNFINPVFTLVSFDYCLDYILSRKEFSIHEFDREPKIVRFYDQTLNSFFLFIILSISIISRFVSIENSIILYSVFMVFDTYHHFLIDKLIINVTNLFQISVKLFIGEIDQSGKVMDFLSKKLGSSWDYCDKKEKKVYISDEIKIYNFLGDLKNVQIINSLSEDRIEGVRVCDFYRGGVLHMSEKDEWDSDLSLIDLSSIYIIKKRIVVGGFDATSFINCISHSEGTKMKIGAKLISQILSHAEYFFRDFDQKYLLDECIFKLIMNGTAYYGSKVMPNTMWKRFTSDISNLEGGDKIKTITKRGSFKPNPNFEKNAEKIKEKIFSTLIEEKKVDCNSISDSKKNNSKLPDLEKKTMIMDKKPVLIKKIRTKTQDLDFIGITKGEPKYRDNPIKVKVKSEKKIKVFTYREILENNLKEIKDSMIKKESKKLNVVLRAVKKNSPPKTEKEIQFIIEKNVEKINEKIKTIEADKPLRPEFMQSIEIYNHQKLMKTVKNKNLWELQYSADHDVAGRMIGGLKTTEKEIEGKIMVKFARKQKEIENVNYIDENYYDILLNQKFENENDTLNKINEKKEEKIKEKIKEKLKEICLESTEKILNSSNYQFNSKISKCKKVKKSELRSFKFLKKREENVNAKNAMIDFVNTVKNNIKNTSMSLKLTNYIKELNKNRNIFSTEKYKTIIGKCKFLKKEINKNVKLYHDKIDKIFIEKKFSVHYHDFIQ